MARASARRNDFRGFISIAGRTGYLSSTYAIRILVADRTRIESSPSVAAAAASDVA